jgi:hypothetical protein
MRVTWISTNDKNGGGPWQSGWKEHAVPLLDGEDENMSSVALGKRRALCGLRPRHGWGIDLFIDEKCKRCEAEAGRA